MYHDINQYWRELSGALEATRLDGVASIAGELIACYRRRGTVFVVGNGGSAATASHIACDFAKGTRAGGVPTFKVLCPTDSIPLLTAWSNDACYADALAEQIAPFIEPGDVLVAISTSGNSPNVLRAVEVGRQAGARILALTGRDGGRLGRLADVVVRVPSDSIEQVEDVHVVIGHSLCVALRNEIRTLRPEVPIAAEVLAREGHVFGEEPALPGE
jgi:D-sedoheptulose 7-phosphate isomerase